MQSPLNPGKLWAVVLFEKGKKYSRVPRSWITSDFKSCYWPPSTGKNSTLINDPFSHPERTWKSFPVSYVKLYSKFYKLYDFYKLIN